MERYRCYSDIPNGSLTFVQTDLVAELAKFAERYMDVHAKEAGRADKADKADQGPP